MIPAMYSMMVMTTAMITRMITTSSALLDVIATELSADTAYMPHRPKPYSGRYGPERKPGLIHFRSGFALEKKRRKNTSMHHPRQLPIKNKKAKINTLFISNTPSPVSA